MNAHRKHDAINLTNAMSKPIICLRFHQSTLLQLNKNVTRKYE